MLCKSVQRLSDNFVFWVQDNDANMLILAGIIFVQHVLVG